MLINVSTLLTEPVGHARRLHAERERCSVPEEGFEQEVTGEIRLIRSERGILVMATFELAPVTLECGRCLEPFQTPVRLDFDEEYVLPRDPVTGQAPQVDGDDFLIDDKRHLDLSEAVRQYEQSALPIQPICRPDCEGLCVTCGRNLNLETCACLPVGRTDPWGALRPLAERLQTEDGDGSPKA